MTHTTPPPVSYLIVDDDDAFRERVVRGLRLRGSLAEGAGSHADAVAAATRVRPARAIVDLRLPDGSGLDVLRDIREINPAITVVVLTGYGSIATAIESLRLGAHHYLSKPVDIDQMLAAFDAEPAAPPSPPDDVPSLARVEWEHIQRVMTDCGGNISQAARLLGLHRRSLQRKLAKFPVRR